MAGQIRWAHSTTVTCTAANHLGPPDSVQTTARRQSHKRVARYRYNQSPGNGAQVTDANRGELRRTQTFAGRLGQGPALATTQVADLASLARGIAHTRYTASVL